MSELVRWLAGSGSACPPRPFPPHQLTNSPTHQLTNSPTHQLTNSPTHQLTNSPTHQLTNSPTHQLTAVHAAIWPAAIHTGVAPFMALTQKKRAGGKPLTPISSESPVRTGIFSPSSTTASLNESLSTTPAWRTDSGPELIAN